jgi:hypothetical protein
MKEVYKKELVEKGIFQEPSRIESFMVACFKRAHLSTTRMFR